MLAWIFETLWHMLVGLVLLIGFFGGAVFVLGRALGNGTFTDHDVQRCQCPACMGKRARAWDRHKERTGQSTTKPVNKRTKAGGWLSTEELRTADRIGAKGGTFEVVSLIGDAKGVQVHLNNLGTGTRSMVFVRMGLLQTRIWKKAD